MRRAEAIRFEMPGELVSPAAWYGRDMSENHSWLEQLSAEEVGEILTAVRTVNDKNVSMLGMRREDFNLPTLSARMQQLARELDQGRGFWVLRGLPVDKMSERDAALAYWGLGLHMGTPVSQNARGICLGMSSMKALIYATTAYVDIRPLADCHIIPTAQTWWGCYACSRQNRAALVQ